MNEIAGIVMAAMLFAGFGFLTRGKKTRDCHDCLDKDGTDSCARCGEARSVAGPIGPHTAGIPPTLNT
jgi:hypothetical protein